MPEGQRNAGMSPGAAGRSAFGRSAFGRSARATRIPRAGCLNSGWRELILPRRRPAPAASRTTRSLLRFTGWYRTGGRRRVFCNRLAFALPQGQNIIGDYVEIRFLRIGVDSHQILAAIGKAQLAVAPASVSWNDCACGGLAERERGASLRGRLSRRPVLWHFPRWRCGVRGRHPQGARRPGARCRRGSARSVR